MLVELPEGYCFGISGFVRLLGFPGSTVENNQPLRLNCHGDTPYHAPPMFG
jgi:hypothetical protein